MKSYTSDVAWAGRVLRDLTPKRSGTPAFPWRKHRDPYRIFLAEVLLVRTRATLVAKHFEVICFRYPNLQSLASADLETMQGVLQPLGLIKRSALLIKAAKYILRENDGRIPVNIDDLVAIPGIGPYTAAAITAFAYGTSVIPADVNVIRMVSRLTGLPMLYKTKASKELASVMPILSVNKEGPKAEILLDFSREVCRPQRPVCDECPLRVRCKFLQDYHEHGKENSRR